MSVQFQVQLVMILFQLLNSFKNAEICLETCKNDTTLQIDNGEYEIFSKDYDISYDSDVKSTYSRSDNQICFSNEKGDYDIYWIEEHELV